jgi:hypothetical protein
MNIFGIFDGYVQEIQKNLSTGLSTEHTHRSALKKLIESLGDGMQAINEPRRVECGSPDYVIIKSDIPIGYIEAKDVGTNLNREERSEQMTRYRDTLPNLILTDYIEFRWFLDGELKGTAQIGNLSRDLKIKKVEDGINAVANLINSFLAQEMPIVGRADDLARRMANSARMLCDAIESTFKQEGEKEELHAQFKAFKETLIPDLTTSQFADMYAQTIAYGLFAARVRVQNQEFTREKAAWNMPKTNPFLCKLFYKIAGPDLDDRIAWIADNLAHLLARADMTEILRDFGSKKGREDPVVHFYETFLAKSA